MQDAQLRLERWRVDHKDFTGSGVAIADTAFYDFTVTAAAATPNQFSVSAAPLGSQAKDTCGTMTITVNAGVVSKTPANTSCW
ncbi:MAG: type IV pilin protein [Steroidobacteraceae bacterium]|nr:type IV pilin protein [Steroidobacteraceae bacterium]